MVGAAAALPLGIRYARTVDACCLLRPTKLKSRWLAGQLDRVMDLVYLVSPCKRLVVGDHHDAKDDDFCSPPLRRDKWPIPEGTGHSHS